MAKKITKSFYDWCIENKHEDWLLLWDYVLNNCNPKDVGYGASKKKYWFKCPEGFHESELKSLNHITRVGRTLSCNQCNFYSFEQWCMDNGKEDWLGLWDYELNKYSPNEVTYSSGKKYYFKCSRGIHESESTTLDSLTSMNNIMCNKCNSFGQYLIDVFGKDALERYWDYNKNKMNPFELAKYSSKKSMD